jgi:hypothetical protein
MKRLRHLSALVGIVLVPSALLYALDWLLFRHPRDIAFYTLMDLAFLPVQAILVSLVLEAFLSQRESQARTRKLGMVSGAFFSEVGEELLRLLSGGDARLEERRRVLSVGAAWSASDFSAAAKASHALGSALSVRQEALPALAAFLAARRGFLLRLLENPLLLDHEVVTDALMSVFHVHDELRLREDYAGLPQSDLAHLGADLERAYGCLLEARLVHLEALRSSYPFLYSLALRSDPLAPAAAPLVLR